MFRCLVFKVVLIILIMFFLGGGVGGGCGLAKGLIGTSSSGFRGFYDFFCIGLGF